MKTRISQYIAIILTITAIAGGYFYFQSKADQKINSSKVNNLTSGLVGYWTMDGADTTATTALDMSTNDNVGTINGTVTKVIGKIGQAFSFDGSTGYLNAGTPNLGITTGITECAWIYPKNVSGNSIILHYANSTDGDNLFFRIGGSAGKIDITDENITSLYSNETLSANIWYHVCVTLVPTAGPNNDVFKIYINGNLDNSTATGNYNPYSTSYLAIGSRGNGTNKFNGYIDEARIYNRALSASEITELYQQGQTKINASQVNKLTNGLVGYWTMDGNDTSWSGNTATLTNKGSLGATANGTSSGMSQTTSPAIGKVGQAFSFDGNNDRISASTVYADTGITTMCIWMKTNSLASTQIFYHYSYASPAANLFWRLHTNGQLNIANGNTDVYNTAVGAIQANTWYHLCHTSSPNKFYINGADAAGSAGGTGPSPEGSELSIGSRIGGSSFFNGKLDEARIYNRALSQSEVTELYNQGR